MPIKINGNLFFDLNKGLIQPHIHNIDISELSFHTTANASNSYCMEDKMTLLDTVC